MEQQFSLRWNNYLGQITDAFGSLRYEEDLVDVTLSCEGGKLKAHRMLLSACSPYFRDVFKENPCQHPVIVFRDAKLRDLHAILDFIYKGEVCVLQENIESFLRTAEELQIKGLSDGNDKDITLEEEEDSVAPIKSNRGTGTERVKLKASTNSLPSPERTCTRLASPTAKKRKLDGNCQDNPSERTGSPVEPNIKQEIVLVEEKKSDEDTEMPLNPTSDPLHIPENSKLNESSVDADSSSGLKLGKLLVTTEDDNEPMEKEDSTPNKESGNEKPTDEEVLSEVKKSVEEEVTTSVEIITAPATQEALKNKDSEVSKESCKLVKKDILKTAPLKSSLKSKGTLHLPKGLTVTVGPVDKKQPLKDLSEPVESDEATALRSEEAKTPVQEETFGFQGYPYQQPDFPDVTTTSGMVNVGEPVMAEEAPQVDLATEEADVPAEEEKEPEFDYYGCEICKTEAKPVDRFNFNHKCPICPCACFCSHLLKEHMKVIHGWFNVQRRFTQF